LINKIVPIFDNFPVIGAKKYQYDFFREHLITKSTVYSIDVHTEIRR